MVRSIALILCLFLTGCGSCEQPTVPSIPVSDIVFIDGDTFLYKNETVRLLGCDTPEVPNAYHWGSQEPWGTRATQFAWQAVQDAGQISIEYADTDDKYGRRLAHLLLDGVPLAVLLIRAGLAYENVSHFGDNGFPEYAAMILESVGPKPQFQEPWLWRRAHRRR